MERRVLTGSAYLDKALGGGLPSGEIVLVYGEAETGKSALAMQCAVNSARIGSKTLYVDCEGTFTPERLSQIAHSDFREVSDMIIVVRPNSFQEQIRVIDNLEKYVNRRFGLIVFDTITSLYRSEITTREESFNLNRELNRQVAMLLQIGRTLPASILLLSQVRSIPEATNIAPVATRILEFWSRYIVRLSRTGRRNIIRARVEEAGGRKRISFLLSIEEEGIRDYEYQV